MRRRRQQVLWWCLTGYVIALFCVLPVALPCWNGGVRDVVGRFVTVEAIHVIQYAGLGWLAASYAWACEAPHRKWMGLIALCAGIGLCDEGAQGILPQRVFQWSDVGLNWTGILLGLFLSGVGRWLGSVVECRARQNSQGAANDDL